MNILFYRYGSICEDDILRCLKESGHLVDTIEDEISNKTLTGSDSFKLVDSKLSKNTYDCVFTINYFPSVSDICNVYKIRYICWIVDSPVLELFHKSIRNPVNRVFVFDRAQYEEIKVFNPECIFHFPLAVDTKSKQDAIERAKADGSYEKYRCDVSFVGSLYTEKDPMLSVGVIPDYTKGFLTGLCEAQMRVYGYWFVEEQLSDRVISEFTDNATDYYRMKAENFLSDRIVIGQYYMGNHITAMEREYLIRLIAEKKDIDVYTRSDTSRIGKACVKGGCDTLTDMPVIFNASRININPTSKAIRSGIPLRVFDILACEGFLLSNYQPELCELFIPGEDFVFYESPEQVPELISYYLNNEDERSRIAHNGYVKVSRDYSYILRLNALLLAAFEK